MILTRHLFLRRRFQAEVGYNFLAKRAENVELECSWKQGPALKHFLGEGQTNPIRTITGSPYYEQVVENMTQDFVLIPTPVEPARYEMSLIKEEDLDLNSAATPAIFSNTLYGTLGFHLREREYPLFGNLGGSYTFSKNNDASPRRWIIWVKMGVSY